MAETFNDAPLTAPLECSPHSVLSKALERAKKLEILAWRSYMTLKEN